MLGKSKNGVPGDIFKEGTSGTGEGEAWGGPSHVTVERGLCCYTSLQRVKEKGTERVKLPTPGSGDETPNAR